LIPIIVITTVELSTSEYAQLSKQVQNIFQKGKYELQDLLNEVNEVVSSSLIPV
jgi:hypothetical protein